MLIEDKMCYSKLVWLMRNPYFIKSVHDVKFSKPLFEYESMAGYIETDVEFTVTNIHDFGIAYNEYNENYEEIVAEYRKLIERYNTCSK